MSSEHSFFWRHKILTGFLILILLVVAYVGYRTIGPYRSYRVDLVNVGPENPPGVLEVGVAKRDITPPLELYDTYNDENDNNAYDWRPFWSKQKSETYNDRNKNGRFDAVWIAGFGSNRPAKGVHDPIGLRAIAFRNNGVTLVMVTLDAIGVFHEKFIDIRKRIDPSLKIDHIMFSSLHNHETPDTMGNWSGPIPLPRNFDYAHMERIKVACKEAVEEAVRNLQPAEMYYVPIEINPEGFVDDSRKPIVIDKTIRCMRFVKPGTDDTIATVVNWSNHPETLGGHNPYITADFPGYWRDGVENGVPDPNGVKGLGGMCLYFQGMVGGLMTELHTTVPHRNGVDTFKDETFEKAQALGENLAILTVKALRGPQVAKCEHPRVGVAAKTMYAPLGGLFRYAIFLGLLHPGVFWTSGGMSARSEVDVLRIGDVEIVTVPGELYPEIGLGGVEAQPGRDFPIEPVEVPPLCEAMDGKMNLIIGLANDEIGYIIPKSQWDAKPPFVYSDKSQYGEENSGGPNVAPTVHREALGLLKRFQGAWPKSSPQS